MSDTPPGTRDRLIRAGIELLADDGPDALALRSIARRAGVSHGAPRRYFPTHRSLLAAIAATGLDDLAVEVRASLAGGSIPVRERLIAAALAYVDFAEHRRGMFELMFRHDLLDSAGANLRATSLPLLEDLGRAVAEACPDRSADDITAVTMRLWTSIHGIAVLHGNRVFDLVGSLDVHALVADAVESALTL
ncbi:MAG: TetR/AcrR family transcriptional regulator [Gordonia amarae]